MLRMTVKTGRPVSVPAPAEHTFWTEAGPLPPPRAGPDLAVGWWRGEAKPLLVGQNGGVAGWYPIPLPTHG